MGAKGPGPGERPPVVFLMGPTASGKTDLAVAAAEGLPVDLISVDSAMVYRGMDVGTAKPGPEVLVRAPHRLIDICDPRDAYSAGRFRVDALAEIRASHERGRIPLLVGGTMLYFRALERGLAPLPGADPALRRQFEAQAREHGWAVLHARLRVLDPRAAERIHPNDPQRIQRALEVHALTGRPLSELQETPAEDFPYRVLRFALWPADRGALHARIARRLDAMFEAGLVAEVQGLRARGDLHRNLPAMRAVGYRQVWDYLEGRLDAAAMRERALHASRQLAKRQLTWLRRERDLEALEVGSHRSRGRFLHALEAAARAPWARA